MTKTAMGSKCFVRTIPFLLCVAAGVMIGFLFAGMRGIPFVVALCATIVLAILMLLVHRFFDDDYGWIFAEHTRSKTPREAVGETREERLTEFAQKYRLTPRESEILAIIVDNDCTLKEVALEMKISERMVQRHMTSIYQKTDTQSRIGLSLQYFGKYRENAHY